MPPDAQAEADKLLEELGEEYPPSDSLGGAPPGPEQSAAPPPAASSQDLEQMVRELLDAADAELGKLGLAPISAVQRMLILVGAAGTIRKYNLNLDDYPELCLGAGVLWVGYDKYLEGKKIELTKRGAIPPARGELLDRGGPERPDGPERSPAT